MLRWGTTGAFGPRSVSMLSPESREPRPGRAEFAPVATVSVQPEGANVERGLVGRPRPEEWALDRAGGGFRGASSVRPPPDHRSVPAPGLAATGEGGAPDR